jgi:hypothetical protein
LVTQRYKTALICSGVTARTSIVTYCSLTISPQSCSFFFPFPLPPFLGIPLVRARYAQALVRLGLDKYFVRCRIYLGFRSDYLVKCKKKGQITWFSKK